MSKAITRKRPCSICRKWFLPDVRQKGRQKTCSVECSRELHRRNCARWNKKNTAYFKGNYLDKKLEQIDMPTPKTSTSNSNIGKKANLPPESRINLNLPRDVLYHEVGGRNLIILEYLIEQYFCRKRIDSTCFT
jgi:hypothetical protein